MDNPRAPPLLPRSHRRVAFSGSTIIRDEPPTALAPGRPCTSVEVPRSHVNSKVTGSLALTDLHKHVWRNLGQRTSQEFNERSHWSSSSSRATSAPASVTPSPSPPAFTSVSLSTRPAPEWPLTTGLPPIKHHLRSGGTIQLLPPDDVHPLLSVLIDVRIKSSMVCVIAGDGTDMQIFYRSGVHEPLQDILMQSPDKALRPLDGLVLESKDASLYRLASSFVLGVKSRLTLASFHLRPPLTQLPKMTITIFSDGPSAATYELSTVSRVFRIDRKNDLVSIRSKGTPRSTSTNYNLSTWPQNVALQDDRTDVRVALEHASWVDEMASKLSKDELPKLKNLSFPFTTRSDRVPLSSRSGKTMTTTKSPDIDVQSNKNNTDSSSLRSRAIAALSKVSSGPAIRRDRPPVGQSTVLKQRRCLPGVGWIVQEDEFQYEVLFGDGAEVKIDTARLELTWKGQVYKFNDSRSDHRIMPGRLRLRVCLLQELLNLF